MVKNLPTNAGDVGSIPGSGRFPGEGTGNLLQYFCLGNPLDRVAWRATVHGVARVGRDLATTPPPPDIYVLTSLSGFIKVCKNQKVFSARINKGSEQLEAKTHLSWFNNNKPNLSSFCYDFHADFDRFS